jgi:ADYC domain
VPVLLALLLLIGAMRPATAAELRSVEADGTLFKVTMSDGTVLRSPDLVGAQLVIAVAGQRVQLRIDAVERDPDAKRDEVWLHTFSIQADDGSWRNPCEAGPDRRRQGFPLAGRVRMPDGLFEPAELGTFELTCTSGAQGKCVRFGYPPWGGEDALALFNACVRMIRADYCGDGEPHTRAGTPIEIYDNTGTEGNQPPAGMELEAVWAPQGAVCVHHVRIGEVFSLDNLKQNCPRFKLEDLGAGCTEERMSRGPSTLLMNKSYTK